jgi:sulfoxide reductase heme-binding subunit YedZ
MFMTPFTDRAGRFSVLKTWAVALLAAPAVWLLVRYWTRDLGPLPYDEALRLTGEWAVRFLMVTLLLTPAQRLLNWSRLALVRRMAGVGAFAYAALHLLFYVAQSKFNLAFVGTEIFSRIYLTIGFTAFFGLSLLAATSTDHAIRTLGARWKMLHRLVYGIAVLGLLHFAMQSKIDVSEPVMMTGFFMLLMIYRAVIRHRLALATPVLAISAVAGGLATAAVEFAWYALATGVDPWRVLAANLMLQFGPRPAVIVAAIGLVVAVLPPARRLLATALQSLRFSPA